MTKIEDVKVHDILRQRRGRYDRPLLLTVEEMCPNHLIVSSSDRSFHWKLNNRNLINYEHIPAGQRGIKG